MIKTIQEQEKKANDLLKPENTIFGGRYVQMLIEEDSLHPDVINPGF
jgi:hypothetical protein